MIDVLVQASTEDSSRAEPPLSPQAGQCWIVGEAATGLWAGREGQLAAWTEGGWRFVPPVAGMTAWDRAAGYFIHFDGIRWTGGIVPAAGLKVNGQQVVGKRQPTVPSPSGGTIIDAKRGRRSIKSLLH